MSDLSSLPAWAKTLQRRDEPGPGAATGSGPRALQLIETYLRYQLSGNPRCSAAVITDYGETVAPAGERGHGVGGLDDQNPRDSLTLTRV